MSKQRRFSKAFKIAAVQQMENGEKNASDLSRELGVGRPTLYLWRDQYRELGDKAFSRSGHGNQPVAETKDSPEDLKRENKRLRKELERAKLDNEILKKATVDSTSQRNSVSNHFVRCFEVQYLSWPVIQPLRYNVEGSLRVP